MSNLFQVNLSDEHLVAQNNLRTNIRFCQKLVQDLERTFNVVIENKRSTELEHETIVYPPSQAGRYGWGFTFSATNEGVTFSDGRGLWLKSMAKVLGATVTDRYEDRVTDLASLKDAASLIGIEVKKLEDRSCGDHFRLKMNLWDGDPKLNLKIKAIIGTMMGQSVTTKL